jgi:hypothetical protein
MLAPAVIFVVLHDRKRLWRWCSAVLLMLMMVLLLRAQMLTPLLTVLMSAGLYFAFSRKLAVFFGCAAATGILVLASFYSASILPTVPTYISDKLDVAQSSAGPLESLQALSGVRSGEIISISEDLISHPARLLFGTGEGSLVTPDPVIPILRFMTDKHYVHAGLFDALYHNGAIAVGAFLVFVVHLFRRARRLHSAGNPFGQCVIITLIVTLILLSYDLPIETAVPVLALCFAGVSVMDRPVSRLPDTARARDARTKMGGVSKRIRPQIPCGASEAGTITRC